MRFNIQHTIYTILIVTLLASCYDQERNCKDFKTGEFTSQVIINGKEQTATFTRNDSIQIETYNGKTDSSSVRWISDCECITKTINPKSMQEKKAVAIKIVSTSGKKYTFEYSFVNDAKKQKGTVTKID